MLGLRESEQAFAGPPGRAPGAVDAGGLPVGPADHAVRGPAAVAAPGPRGRRRAPLPVHRELDAGSFWIYDFGLRCPRPSPRPAACGRSSRTPSTALWHGQTEDDGFNALVLTAGLTWREVTLLRAYAKYLRQAGVAVQPGLPASGAARQCAHHPAPGRGCSSPVRPGPAQRRGRALRGDHRGDPRPARRGGQPRPRPDPAGLPGPDRRDPAHQLLPGASGKRRTWPTSCSSSTRATCRSSPQPRPRFEIFVYSPRLEGVHLRFGRVARGGLRWSDRPRGLPHRGPRPGQGAGGEERGHRPVRRQGRLRVQAAARPPATARRTRPRSWPATRRSSPPCSTSPTTSSPTRSVPPPRRGPPRRRRPLPGGRGRQGHRHLLRHRQRDRGALRLLAGRRVRLRRLGRLRPQEDGHHRARRLGVGQAPFPRARHRHPDTDDFTVAGIGDMSGDVFGNGMLLSRAHQAGRGVRPPAHLPRPRPRPGASASPSASGCSTCRAPRGPTTTRR